MKQNQHNKKTLFVKEEPRPCWYCECIMRVRAREVNKVNDEASRACPKRWRNKCDDHLAMLYEGRCSERQHGPTNFIHRSEHDPERKRRMMQARVYGMVSATRERVRTLMKC